MHICLQSILIAVIMLLYLDDNGPTHNVKIRSSAKKVTSLQAFGNTLAFLRMKRKSFG